MQRRYNIRSRLEGDRRFVNVFNYLNYKKLFGDSNWYGLPILRQLEIYAGEDSYPKFCRHIRDNNYDGISKRERIVVGFSKIVGHDLSPHLDRTALYQCGSNCKNYIKDLPPCNVSIEYIVERHFYDRKEVPSTAVPKILAVYILDDGRLRFLVDFEGGGSWSNMGGVEIRDEDENFVCFLDSSDIIISADKWEPGKVFKFRGFGLDMKMRQPLVYKVPSKFHRSTFNFSVHISNQQNSALSGMMDDDNSTCLFTDPLSSKELTVLIIDAEIPRELVGIRWAQTRGNAGKTKHFTIHTSLDNESWTELFVYHQNLTFF
ncbi:hypothetical protein TVAG_289560 [Trichomonas vaginalis G3]|uniref:F5/8 type C domain-containing protein n=1 Tax=Trichomonas vaginalis (strain ATCC PRA-98 / G3) TaxID=412133 RepID=A2G9X9_TRIV3|nr:peptidase M60-like family [Trichomonas vaginalis G3]EAX86037.1 hypothetical protein TVAG_289560 [Trichomonas vaginalis G3]KAI5549723.1 peptidase M60-like family [Trichomonas vaginalis G3]|eukprot:XP_001298967.1 hypothetical protein [Trichomonas vaginalis G3]